MKLSVGDVIFVIDKKTQAVVPCQLIEIISSVTLEGEQVKHIASTPGSKKFTLEEYDSLWFESYEKAKSYLTNAALKLVDSTMKRAEEAAIKTFGYAPLRPAEEVSTEEQAESSYSSSQETNISDTEQVFVDIGGQQVKVTLPKELANE